MATNLSDLEVRILGTDELTPKLKSLESTAIRALGSISAAIAGIKLVGAPIQAAVELERELANVQKTTNFTSGQIKTLSNDLLDLSLTLNVSAKDLAKIASAAGQQGLGKEGVKGIVQFTESVARMSSVLDLTATEAAEGIGKLANIFKIPLAEIERTVSTFNEVSNNSTAKGRDLLDVVRRLGDAAGALNIQQSTALAATALDFGTSAEVAGSAFTKFFASMTQKSAEFGRLLKGQVSELGYQFDGTADNFGEHLKENGVDALKAVLAQLRTLGSADQTNTYIKLLGGGRYGALLTKFIQDSTNSVLDKNLSNSNKGFDGGTSALKEQATVLNTVTEQSKLALNALTKLGIDATQDLLAPLIRYLHDLREGLQDPALLSFFKNLSKAIGETLGTIVGFVKTVAGLNVNWGNFVGVVKVFLELKLGEALFAIAGRMVATATGLLSVGKNAGSAAAGLTAVGTASKLSSEAQAKADASAASSLAGRLLGYEKLSAAIATNSKVQLEGAALVAQLEQRQAAAGAARAADIAAQAAASRGQGVINQRSQNVTTARSGLTQAVQAAADAEVAVQARKSARLIQAEQENATKLAAIEAAYQARKAEIAATGTQTGLKAARATRAQEIAEQEASYARSVTQVESYWARRLAIVRASSQAEVDLQKLAVIQANGKLDATLSRQQGRQSAAAGTAAGALASAGQVAATSNALAANSSAAALATRGVFNLSLAWETLGSVVVRTGALLFRVLNIFNLVYLAGTVLYSVLDHFKLLDSLGGVFQYLGDAIGYSSEKQRAASVAAEEAIEKRKRERLAVDELTKAYDKAKDAASGVVSTKTIDALTTQASTSDSGAARTDAYNQLLDIAAGAKEKAKQAVQDATDDISRERAEFQKKALEAQNQLTLLMSRQVRSGLDLSKDSKSTRDYNEKLAAQAKLAKEAADGLAYLADKAKNSNQTVKDAGVSYDNAAAGLAKLFTPRSREVAIAFGQELLDNQVKVDKLTEDYKKASEAAGQVDRENKAGRKTADDAAESIRAQLGVQNQFGDAIKNSFRLVVEQQKAVPGLSEASKKALDDLLLNIDKGQLGLQALLLAARSLDPNKLTGEGSGVRSKPPTTGTGTFDPKEAKNRASQEAKARIELAKAVALSVSSLQEELNRQALAQDQKFYDLGLLSIEGYYARKEKIAQNNITTEIQRRNADIAAVNAEIPSADKTQGLRLRAELVRLSSEIKVLETSRQGVIQQTKDDIEKAVIAAKDQVLSINNRLAQEGIMPQGIVEAFQNQLNEMIAANRAALQTLIKDSNGDAGNANRLIDSFKLKIAGDLIPSSNGKLAIDFTALDQYQQRLQLLQDQGKITAQDFTNLYGKSVTDALPGMYALLAEQEKVLEQNKALANTDAYRRLAQGVESARLRIQALYNETNKVAIGINNQIGDALTNTFANLEFSLKGLKESARGFLLSVVDNLKQAAAKNLSDITLQAAGTDGAGGVGGFFQGLLGETGAKRGETPGNPTYVTDVGKLGAGNVPFDGSGPISQFDTKQDSVFQSFVTKARGAFDSVTDSVSEGYGKVKGFFSDLFTDGENTFGGIFDLLKGSFGSTFDSLSSTFSDVFSSFGSSATDIFSSLSDTLSSLFSGGGGGDSSGFYASIIAAFAHTGGIIGSSSLRTGVVSPAVFRNAAMYHSGGVIGLKPNEVPIIAESGEEMLTRNDPRHRDNLKSAKTGEGQETTGAGGTVNVWVVSPDRQPTMGPSDVVAIVGDNINRNGSLKKLIKTVQQGG